MTDALDVGSEIVPVAPQGIVRAAGTVVELAEAQDEYRALCDRLCVPDDYQTIGAKKFRKKSGWRKLAVAFNVSVELISEDYREDDGHITRAKIVMRATAPNGRFMDGIGLCDLSERNFSKPDHDIPATAMTRATNRACADLFGLGEVSAEEASTDWSQDAQSWEQSSWEAPERGMQTKRTGPGGHKLVSSNQASAAYAMTAGVVDKDQALSFISAAVGREITHTKNLTVSEFDKLRAKVDAK